MAMGAEPLGNKVYRGLLSTVALIFCIFPVFTGSITSADATTLHDAAESGDATKVRELLKASGKVDERNSEGLTALHAAAHAGHLDVVEILVEAGADIEAMEKNGWTALTLGANQGHLSIAVFLVEVGANINAADREGRTPLYWAAINDKRDVFEKLKAAGARTPLIPQSPLVHYANLGDEVSVSY